jgi:cytochrome c oxidase subunit 2
LGNSRRDRIIVAIIATVILVGVTTVALYAIFVGTNDDPQTTFAPQSENTQRVQDVYLIVWWLAGAVFVGILSLTLIFAIVFRERPGGEAQQIHGNSRLEVVWTLIPVLIVVAMAVPTFDVIIKTTDDPPEGALEIVATGHQWWFEFEYTEAGVVTANELHVPAGQAVSVRLRSDDVIHSFWAPQLTGKVDMVPGHENNLWFTPDEDAVRDEPYLGQCAEFCSTSHANMRFRVYVDTPEDFAAWLAEQGADRVEPAQGAAATGEQIFTSNACIGCHTIRGTTAAGQIGPDLTHVGGRGTIAAGILDNTPENLTAWLRNPPREKPGVIMPAAADLGLSDEEIANLVAYLSGLD